MGSSAVSDSEHAQAKDDYSGWGSKYNYRWPLELYDQPAFRLLYVENRFQGRFAELAALFERFATSLAGYQLLSSFVSERSRRVQPKGLFASLRRWLFGERPVAIKLLSIGCGPGVDAVALIHVLGTVLPSWAEHNGLQTLPANITFDVTLVDAAPGWEDAAIAAVEAAAPSATVCFIPGTFEDPDVAAAAVSPFAQLSRYVQRAVAAAVIHFTTISRHHHPLCCHICQADASHRTSLALVCLHAAPDEIWPE